MSSQRRTSTSGPGAAVPGRDDEYPTDTFDSVGASEEGLEDSGWDELVGTSSPARSRPRASAPAPVHVAHASGAAEDDERPTQVFSAIRDDPGEQRRPAAGKSVGTTAAPEEDDTAVFTRYRDGDPDPRASQATPAVRPAPRGDEHTEQFAAYQDQAAHRGEAAHQGQAGADTRHTGGAGAPPRPGPGVVPGLGSPPVAPIPTGSGRPGAGREPGTSETPRPSGGKRALREPVEQTPSEQRDGAEQGDGSRSQDHGEPHAGADAESVAGALEQTPEADGADGSAAEPVLDKKAAKRLAKEREQAAKDAAKAEKVAAERAAKDEKAAAKAAKKSGRGRGRGGPVETSGTAGLSGTGSAPATAAGLESATATETAAASDATAAASDGTAAAPEASAAAPDATAVPAAARRKAPVLVVLLLLFIAVASGAAAWLFHQQAATASKQRPSSNIALLDKSATAEAIAQVTKAVEAVYSYDSASLDQSESAALSQITGSYVSEFQDNFAAVRALPPQERASLSSKVVAAGVITLTERRANLLVMLDQVGRRGANSAPVQSAVRLSVTAQRVDGQWKVSDISQK